MFNEILSALADIISIIAYLGAGSASTINGFQPDLPEALQNANKKNK